MKVVLAHDWLLKMRGGERVLEAISELFPEAPIYSLFLQKNQLSPWLQSRDLIPSSWNRPFTQKNYQKLLPLLPRIAESISVPEDTDVVITTSHCVINGLRRPDRAKHFSYIFSPMRYMTDLFDEYFPSKKPVRRILGSLFRPSMLSWEREVQKQIHHLSSNSGFIKDRIRRYWDRQDVEVIHSFVDVDRFTVTDRKDDYFLCVSALTPYKRVDLAVAACMKTNQRLLVVGQGEELESLKNMAQRNPKIEFIEKASDQDVARYFQRAQALIFPGIEDFGITPLEAMASGTPVIGLGAGGLLETVTPETGVFFYEQNIDSLVAGMETFFKKSYDLGVLRARAEMFSRQKFKEAFRSWVERSLSGS